MLLLVLGIAAAFGTIAWITFGLLSLVEEGVQTPYEAYQETGDEEESLPKEAASIEAY